VARFDAPIVVDGRTRIHVVIESDESGSRAVGTCMIHGGPVTLFSHSEERSRRNRTTLPGERPRSAAQAPKVIETRTEERGGRTYTVTVLEDGERRTPAPTFGRRKKKFRRPIERKRRTQGKRE
jgi:hypothetical protein